MLFALDMLFSRIHFPIISSSLLKMAVRSAGVVADAGTVVFFLSRSIISTYLDVVNVFC